MRHSYNTIDLMKMIAAIFVVAIHSQPFSGLTEVLVICRTRKSTCKAKLFFNRINFSSFNN